MLLVGHEPNSLTNFAEYIFYRTGGSIGAVSTLIRQGANLAIKEGEEEISKKLLDRILLDEGSEDFYSRYLARKRRPSHKKKEKPEK